MSEKIISLKEHQEKTKSNKILLWSCLGPILLMLALLAISLMKAWLPIYLGVFASFTLLAIFFLGLKGLILGWVLEAMVIAYYFPLEGTYEGPFLLLATLSLSLSHLIFFLGIKEASSLVETLEVESKSRLNALWKLEEKTRQGEKNALQKPRIKDDEEQEIIRLKLADREKTLEKALKDLETLKKEKEALVASYADLDLKTELEEARRELEMREKEELRLKTMHEEMSSHIDLLQNEQEVLTSAIVKGESLGLKKDEEIAHLSAEVEKLSTLYQEIASQNQTRDNAYNVQAESYKEKEFLLRGIVQEAHLKNAQLEREVKELKSKNPDMEAHLQEKEALQKSLAAKEALLKEKLEAEKAFYQRISALEEEVSAKGEALTVKEAALKERQEAEEAFYERISALEEEVSAKGEHFAANEALFKEKQEAERTFRERINALEENVSMKSECLEAKEAELKEKQEAEEAFYQRIRALEKEVSLKSERLASKEAVLKEKEDAEEAFYQRLSALEAEVTTKEEQLVAKESILKEKQEAEEAFYKRISTLEDELSSKEASASEIIKLKENQEVLLNQIKTLEETSPLSDKEVLKKLESATKDKDKYKNFIFELKALRKDDAKKIKELQGLHKQLKQQFDEKSASLDDSRKALFHMQEKIFTLQREVEELPKNDVSEIESLLEAQMKKMEEERALASKEHQEEVDSLQDVIEALLQKG